MKMKIKIKKFINIICTLVLLLTTILPNLGLMSSAVFASSATVQYNGSVTYGGSTVGNFTVNGEQAFCMEHSKTTPSTNTAITSQVYNNENIAKCLYYGWSGEEQWSGFTSKQMGIVITSLALDYYYNGKTHNIANDFISFVNSKSLPKQYLNFSNSNLTAYKDGDIQRTENVTLEGNSQYSISLNLQDGVTLHNITKNTTSTGNASIYGGDTFYLSTPLNSGVTGSWTSNNIDNTCYKYSSIVWVTASDSVQDLAQKGNFILDPGRTINLSVSWISLGGITIEKRNENGDALQGVSFKIWNDSGYSTTATTNADGRIILNNLTPSTFYIQEISSIDGYILNDTVYTSNVKAGVDASGNIKIIENKEATGTLSIIKTNTNGDNLAGATFTITAAEDICNTAKTVKYYSKGDTVATVTTGSNGTATKEGLPLGKYTVTETSAPSGYILNTESKNVTLSYENQNTSVVYGSVTIVNKEPTGTIAVTKTNTNGDTVSNTTFTITAAEDVYNTAKTVKYYSKGDKVATVITEDNGIATKTGLPLGKYIVTETNVPSGYLINKESKNITLGYENQNMEVIYASTTIENKEPTRNT
jgi:hypothetical protein